MKDFLKLGLQNYSMIGVERAYQEIMVSVFYPVVAQAFVSCSIIEAMTFLWYLSLLKPNLN